jgi:hypothetical protein
MSVSIIEYGENVLEAVVPGASIITGAIRTVASWIGAKGKTKEASWNDVRKVFEPYFQSVHQVYFSENYSYELANIDDGLPLASKNRGIWVVGMFLVPKGNPKGGFGPVVWARYGTAENRIGNSGFSNADAVGASRDVGKTLPSAAELYTSFVNRGFKLNKKAGDEAVLEYGEKVISKDEGIPVNVKFSLASFGPYVQYLLIGVVIAAMVFMFKKK